MNVESATNSVLTPLVDDLTGSPLDLTILETEASGITLSVDNLTGLPGETVTVPILISDATDVVSLNLFLTYDTDILSIPDPDPETDTNEGVRRTGVSENWVLGDNANPVANVNSETGEVTISLVKTDTEPNPDFGRILEIDFQIADGAEIGTTATVDLQPSEEDSRIGIGDEDFILPDSLLQDGDITVNESNELELYRFRNTTFDTGTYVFVGALERDAILADPNLNQTFELEGNGNPAFVASTISGEEYIPFFRLSSIDVPGTFLFVSTPEYDAIFADGSDQRDKWERQGFDGEGNDIPEFYLYSPSSGLGLPFNRYQNRSNGTFLYAGPAETDAIDSNPDFSNAFVKQGGAFESLI